MKPANQMPCFALVQNNSNHRSKRSNVTQQPPTHDQLTMSSSIICILTISLIIASLSRADTTESYSKHDALPPHARDVCALITIADHVHPAESIQFDAAMTAITDMLTGQAHAVSQACEHFASPLHAAVYLANSRILSLLLEHPSSHSLRTARLPSSSIPSPSGPPLDNAAWLRFAATHSSHLQRSIRGRAQLPLTILALKPSLLFHRSEPISMTDDSTTTSQRTEPACTQHDGVCTRKEIPSRGLPPNQALNRGDLITWLLLRILSHPGGYPINNATRDGSMHTSDSVAAYQRALCQSAQHTNTYVGDVQLGLQSLLERFDSSDARLAQDALCHSPSLMHIAANTLTRPKFSMFSHTFKEMQAAANEHQNVLLQLLLDHDMVNVHERDPYRMRTPLHIAAESGNLHSVRALLSRGSDPTAPDVFGWTSLHMAARSLSQDVFEVIVEAALRFTPNPAACTINGDDCDTQPLASIRDWMGRTAGDIMSVLSTPLNTPYHNEPPKNDSPTTPSSADIPASTTSPRDPYGGWPAFEATSLRVARCDIAEERADISSEDFINKYVSIGLPVIIRGGARNVSMTTRWTAGTFASEYDTMRFPVSHVPYTAVYGSRSSTTTLGEFVEVIRAFTASLATSSETPPPSAPYIFTELDSRLAARFGSDLDGIRNANILSLLPGAMAPHLPQFYLGPAYSGAQMHFHQDALNTLAFGRKRWFLTAPQDSAFTTQPVLQWLEQDYERLKTQGVRVFECMQEAGDIIYVPMQWGHAVLNTMASVGVATNFEQPFRSF